MLEKESEKSDFVRFYDSETQENEFLYNIIELSLDRLKLKLMGPTRYDLKSATYMVYEDLDIPVLKLQILNVLDEIERIEMLKSYDDSTNIFLDKKAVLKEKVFFYQPFRTVYDTATFLQKKALLRRKIVDSKMTKKSTLYKVCFD